jgi:hypothetical protein
MKKERREGGRERERERERHGYVYVSDIEGYV